jgi:hypothetical protein
MKLGIFAYHDKLQIEKGRSSENNIFRFMPLYNLEFLTDECKHSNQWSCSDYELYKSSS